jgi:hypothetical protein
MTEQQLLEARTAFTLDTLEYFCTDTNRRCVGVVCKYSPLNANKKGVSEGCAIGRHMTPRAQILADMYPTSGIGSIIEKDPSLVPKKLRDLGVDFLQEIQSLHDSHHNWLSKKGLSYQGTLALKEAIQKFKLPESKFKKYFR